jgi:hypothetical protein
MVSWKDLPRPARAIGATVEAAVVAAGGRDREAYEAASGDVIRLPAGTGGQILGALVRSLLEEQHPDGLDSDDIEVVLGRCYRSTTGWLPADRVDVSTMVAVLASALGIHEPGVTYEEITGPTPPRDDWVGDPVGGHVHGGGSTGPVAATVPTPAAYAWHAPLLIADLLADRNFAALLTKAFTEIERAEIND